MKRVSVILMFIGATLVAFGQKGADLGKIALSVTMPATIDGLDAGQVAKLETKLTQAVAATGMVPSASKSNFTLTPTFTILESNVVEGGMAKLTATKIELGLLIKQTDNNAIFSSLTKQLSGSGNSATLAINNAISKVSGSDGQFKKFIDEGKGKILRYYDAHCSEILSKAEGLLMQQNYEQSLALLMSVPSEVDCYNTIQDRSILVYQALQNQKCAKQMQDARVLIAGGKYNYVLDILEKIDPAAACFPEAQTMLGTIGDKIGAEKKDQLEMMKARYKDAEALGKLRTEQIRNIAGSYTGDPARDNNQTPAARPERVAPAAETRGTTAVKHVVDSTVVKQKHRFFALLMGVEQYQDPEIMTLSEPIHDAELLKQILLTNYTFDESNITFLKNPTYEEIYVAFADLADKIQPTDFLLIFYAGHGFFDEKTNIGYWLPSDAQKKNSAKWFRNSALVEDIRAINSKHTLLIADACFSGGIFKTRAPFDNSSTDIADMMGHASRKAMTSGSLTTVPDKSIFMKYLLKSLTENQNKYLPTEDLFDDIKRAMKNNSDTKPLYGEIQNSGDEGGVFVLIRR